MNILDSLFAYGHPLVKCTHKSTIEITRDDYLTKSGTCILGIKATKACFELNENLKQKIKQGKSIRVVIKVDNLLETFIGHGDKRLNLKSKRDMVFRKSNFICDRTVLINCTKSSNDFSRELVDKLKNRNNKFSIIFQSPNQMDN